MGRNRLKYVGAALLALLFVLMPLLVFAQPAPRLPGQAQFPTLLNNGTRAGDARSLNVQGAGNVSCAGTSCTLDVRRGAEYDVRTRSIKCDGTTDDAAAWNTAYTTLSAAGGGTLVVPEGATCMVGSDVILRTGVRVRCGTGSEIKATSGASFSQAMFSSFLASPFQLTADRNSFDGCTFNLNGKRGPALYMSGSGLSVRQSTVKNGSTSQATNQTLVYFNNTGTPSEFSANRVECANTAGAKDIGVNVVGTSGAGAYTVVENNQVINCDIAAITSSGSVAIRENAVTAPGSAAIGIESVGPDTAIVHNRVSATGSSSIGVRSTGTDSTIDGNKIDAAGATGYGIYSTGSYVAIIGNIINLDAPVSGTDTTVGIYVGGSAARVVGNTSVGDPGVPTNTTETVHLVIGAQQASVVANFFTGGLIGVRPDMGALGGAGVINADVIANRFTGQDDAGVYMLTGWVVSDNYLAWVAANGCSIRVGYTASSKYLTTSHSRISNNRLHNGDSGGSGKGICFVEQPASVCDSGTKVAESCTADTLTDCPGASNSCTGVNADCCEAVVTSAVPIVGNECLFPSGGICIDFATGISDTSGSISNFSVIGNVCSLSSTGTCVNFPTANTSKITKIRLVGNTADDGTLYGNFVSSMGSIESTGRSTFKVTGLVTCGVATTYMGVDGCDTTETNVDYPIPAAMTVLGMHCLESTDNTCTMRFTLRKNAADQTAMQCTATNAVACSDTAGSVSFTGGDLLSIKLEDQGLCTDSVPASCVLDVTY